MPKGIAKSNESYVKLHATVVFTEAQAQAISDLAALLDGGSANQPLVTALNLVRRELIKVRRAHALVPAFTRTGDEADAVVREVGRENRARKARGEEPFPAGRPVDKPTKRRIRAAEREARDRASGT